VIRILVHPDRYQETLVIEKAVEIIGHGEEEIGSLRQQKS
jgi:hypothetical protein